MKYRKSQEFLKGLFAKPSYESTVLQDVIQCMSTFAGCRKLNALKLMIEDAELQESFSSLGKEWIVPSYLNDELETFTCQLYLSKTSTTKVDDLRYGLFAEKKCNVEPHHLPHLL